MKALRAMAYWPSAETDVENFCGTCDTCLANRNPMPRLGSSMTSTRRFGVMMIDKLVFDNDVAAIASMPTALLMTCPRIGDQHIRLCASMTAVEAARVIYVAGIPQFPIAMVIVSDSEPAFAAAVMQELAKIFGVQNWDFGPVSSPQRHGQVKRHVDTVEPYNRAIKGAMTAGTITCWRTLEVVLASALITQTQLMATYGSTAFTRRTGAIPRTHRDLYASSCDNMVELKATVWRRTRKYSRHCSARLMSCATGTSIDETWLTERACIQNCRRWLGTDFYLVEGDMVSYHGERWLLLEITGSPNLPMTARIQQATHADAVTIKVVRYDTLRPLASMRGKTYVHR